MYEVWSSTAGDIREEGSPFPKAKTNRQGRGRLSPSLARCPVKLLKTLNEVKDEIVYISTRYRRQITRRRRRARYQVMRTHWAQYSATPTWIDTPSRRKEVALPIWKTEA